MMVFFLMMYFKKFVYEHDSFNQIGTSSDSETFICIKHAVLFGQMSRLASVKDGLWPFTGIWGTEG